MTKVVVAELRDLEQVMLGLEAAGWRTYGKVSAEIMGEVPRQVINSAHQQGLEELRATGVTPALFGVTTRITKHGFGGVTMVMWVAAAPPRED